MSKQQTTAAVGMSGGIDSSTAAMLLRRQGYNVIGLTMRIWNDDIPVEQSKSNACFGPGEQEDIESARRTAERIGIPHYTIDLRREYHDSVLSWFRQCYLDGETPNPCAVCNPVVKFGSLVDKALEQGIEFDFFATGHYARKLDPQPESSHYRLFKGVDPDKDQSYFLARLSQEHLARSLFPLGELTKYQIRAMATELGLGELNKKQESQDFFEGDDPSVLFPDAAVSPGPIVDQQGNRLGTHRGIIHYTIGQREGLGIATGKRMYVREINAETNTIVAAEKDGLTVDSCKVSNISWISGRPPVENSELTVRLRYRHPGVAARFSPLSNHECSLEFAEPQFAVTPGQLAAFYNGMEVLGGGWISKET